MVKTSGRKGVPDPTPPLPLQNFFQLHEDYKITKKYASDIPWQTLITVRPSNSTLKNLKSSN